MFVLYLKFGAVVTRKKARCLGDTEPLCIKQFAFAQHMSRKQSIGTILRLESNVGLVA